MLTPVPAPPCVGRERDGGGSRPECRAVPRWFAEVPTLAGLGVVGAIGAVIGTQVASIAQDIPQYTTTITRKVHAIQDMTTGRLSGLTKRLDTTMGRTAKEANAAQTGVPADETPKAQLVQVQPPPTSAMELARTVLAPIVDPLSTLLIILIVTLFVMMQREDLRDRMIRLFGSNDLQRTTMALDDAGHRLAKYYVAQLAINACFGLVVGLGLWFIGVPSPALWGVTSAVLRFVPYIGPVIAAILPAALAAAVAPSWSMVLWTLGLFVITETVTGQAIEPLAYGHSTGLSPAAVVIAAIFWTWVWGPHRPPAVDPSDALPRRARSARRPVGVPRRHARRPPAADARRELLPAYARR